MKIPKELEPIIVNGEEVTREVLHDLYIVQKVDFRRLAEQLKVNEFVLFYHFKRKRIGLRKNDYWIISKTEEHQRALLREHELKWDEEWKKAEQEKHDALWKRAEELYGEPKPKVTYITVNGRRFADTDLVNHYNAEVEKIYKRLKYGEQKKDTSIMIRSVDLSAMRLHRGLNMFEFSRKSGISYNDVMYYEKTPCVSIPREVSDTYMSTLNISRSEFKKIQEVLAGKRKDMHEEEERPIPDAVKEYVFERDGGKCTKCGRDKYLHYHHKKRYAAGGKHQARNLILLCVACHAEEHAGEKGYHLLKGMANKLLGESAWTDSKATGTYARK